MTKTVLTVTGFILPESPLFIPYVKKDDYLDDLVGRMRNFSHKSKLDYFSANRVHYSPEANEIHANYMANPSLLNFMAMIDFTGSVLSLTDIKTFMQLQAGNRYLSKFSMMMCRDLLRGKLVGKYEYDSLPSDSRFVLEDMLTKHEGNTRYAKITTGATSLDRLNWISVLLPLVNEKVSFVSLFKYLFVYRV